ncbi:hypothetical protein Tco_1364813 [Tanacetum coccineum]
MVINSPCLTDKKELAIPGQTTTGKELSNPLMAGSLPKTIWALTSVTDDGQTFAITEASVRRHLQLADADGDHVPLFNTMLIHDQPGQGEGPTLTVESQHTPIVTSHPMTSQEQPSQVPTTKPITTPTFPPLIEPTIPQTTSSMPHDSPLSGGYTPGSVEGSKKLNELTELYTKLSDKVTSLEQDLRQTKQVYGKALTKLVKKGRISETEYEDIETEHAEEVDAAKILTDASREKTFRSYTRRRSTDSLKVSTAGDLFSTAEEFLSIVEEIAQKLNEEEMAKAAARKEQEEIDFEKAKELQRHG